MHGTLKVAWKAYLHPRHQHCPDEAQKAKTVLSAVFFFLFASWIFNFSVKFNILVKFLSIIITNIYTYIFSFFFFLNKITLFTPLTIQYSTYSTGMHMNLTERGLCSTFPKPFWKRIKEVVTQMVPKTLIIIVLSRILWKVCTSREASLNYGWFQYWPPRNGNV